MSGERTLENLRQEIDQVDEMLHELIMRRSALAEQIRQAKDGAATDLLCPGREAEIMRSLIARHRGRFPRRALIRIWREILGAMVGLQGKFSGTVFMPERGAGYLELARMTYGSNTPMTSFRSAGQVVHTVAEGSATIGILPMPGLESESVEHWWVSLMGDSPDLPRIIGRLPIAPDDSGEETQALVIGHARIEATGFDRSWMAVETHPDISRGRLRSALSAAGLEPTNFVDTLRTEDVWLHLVEIAGMLTPDDRRLVRLCQTRDPVMRAVVLGSHPVPFPSEDLSE